MFSHQTSLFYFICLLIYCGCSISQQQTPTDDSSIGGLLTVDVFFAHQLQISAAVERFYVEDATIWHQCGKIKHGADLFAALSSDNLFFIYPNIELNHKKKMKLKGDEQKKLRYLTLKAVDAVSENSDAYGPVMISKFDEGILDAQLSLGAKWGFTRRSLKQIREKEKRSDQAVSELLEAFESLPLGCD